MKVPKIITAVILILLTVVGWVSLVVDSSNKKNEYANNVTQAAQDMEEGRYQLAIQKLEDAISYKSTVDNWDKLLEAYEKRLAEDSTVAKDYINSLQNAISEFGYEENYVVRLAQLYVSGNKHKNAYDYLSKAVKEGTTSDAVQSYLLEIKYTYSIRMRAFSSFSPMANSSYAVYNGKKWGVISSTGSSDHNFEYQFVSQANSDGIRLFANDEDSRLLDKNGLVLGIFRFMPQDAGIYSENLIAVKKDDEFYYYNSLGEEQFGGFEDAGTFSNGRAAAKKDGQWGIINSKGEFVDDNRFDDIRLSLTGHYITNNIILASKNGSYQIYDNNLKVISDFSCDKIDVYTDDGLIAFESGEKWGFVNVDGKIIIDPQFDSAKSFSNGLAAICVNNEWGFINQDNAQVIKCQFAGADYFNKDGTCLVRTDSVNVDEDATWQIMSLKLGTVGGK